MRSKATMVIRTPFRSPSSVLWEPSKVFLRKSVATLSYLRKASILPQIRIAGHRMTVPSLNPIYSGLTAKARALLFRNSPRRPALDKWDEAQTKA